MAITEAFGGKETPYFYLFCLCVIRNIKYHSVCSAGSKLTTLFHPAEFRTGKTQLSHTLCGE